ncbi:MAG TPA: citrate synthase family protein [Alphaproteobacteria bacterium]|nr:citrate synthase family protein [Alphaproteobacteria bacterium]
MSSAPTLLSAREAAAMLDVGVATLYAYVSRGLLRSEPGPGRTRLYRAEDIAALRGRAEARPAAAPLEWGGPVMDSALTLIADGRLWYRGVPAAKLAEGAQPEGVAALLWGVDDAFADNPPPAVPVPPGLSALPPLERAQALLALAAAADPAAYAEGRAAGARCGARLVRLLAGWLAGAEPGDRPVARVLAEGWGLGDPLAADLIRRALVLAADHEFNVSAFTVRCIASSGATLYAAVAGGIGALLGPRHGGMTARVEALLDEARARGDAEAALAARLRRGDGLPGFGHPLYPAGDPRGAALLAALAAALPRHPERLAVQAAVEAARRLGAAPPTLDVALVAVARCLALPPGAPLALFAAGRSLGWVAHALEQREAGGLIRPRARYTGPPPRGI